MSMTGDTPQLLPQPGKMLAIGSGVAGGAPVLELFEGVDKLHGPACQLWGFPRYTPPEAARRFTRCTRHTPATHLLTELQKQQLLRWQGPRPATLQQQPADRH
jgi:hypothetical protein